MMKLTKIALVASVFATMTTHMSLAKSSQYRLIAFDNCKVVAEHELNQAQISAYQNLKAAEVRIESISHPANSIEDEIDNFTDQISELTNRAIKEDDDSLVIDKKLLREQEEVIKKLESLIKSHEADFAALEKEAQDIEARAKKFEKAIKPLLNNVEHDFVRIIGPDNKDDAYICDGKNIAMITK